MKKAVRAGLLWVGILFASFVFMRFWEANHDVIPPLPLPRPFWEWLFEFMNYPDKTVLSELVYFVVTFVFLSLLTLVVRFLWRRIKAR